MRNAKILIVEDDPLFSRALGEVFSEEDYQVRIAASGAEALTAVGEEGFDILVQDIRLPDANGIDVLKEITTRQPGCGALVMTGYGTVEDAVRAMKLGAFDFITKPFPMELLFDKIQKYLDARRFGDSEEPQSPFPEIITRSPALAAALGIAAKVAPTPAAVLVQEESGTGKELVAEALHRESRRGSGPFVAVNCAAIPASLIESELFGVERGAFTGADRSRGGYIEAAHGGTLFLDEIGELPLELQGKLLRVLEEKACARVGGTMLRGIDFRLISATNRDLSEMVQTREFRADLFYRINVIQVKLPPLRERREDIPLLLGHFLEKFTSAGGAKPELTVEAMEVLSAYRYPGNVRELRNITELISLLYSGCKVYPQQLPQELQQPATLAAAFESFPVGRPLKDAISDYEKKYIEKVVDYAGGRKTVAAQMLGLSRKALWEKLKR
jgi:DNA-binding NtrC family response regulator